MHISIKSALALSIILSQITSLSAIDMRSPLSQEIDDINTTISLQAAPSLVVSSINPIMSPWELIHRTPMLAGFTWTGVIAQYITPAMYVGTPFGDAYMSDMGVGANTLSADPTTYEECLESEAYRSYHLGDRIEETDIRELISISKACARAFYGKYFDGKSYTTREEYLMMLFTLFGEDIKLSGRFDSDGIWTTDSSSRVQTRFSNLRSTDWYTPYVAFADSLNMVGVSGDTWSVAEKISDREAISLLRSYMAHRMDHTGTTLERGMIITSKLKYMITFSSEDSVMIRAQ